MTAESAPTLSDDKSADRAPAGNSAPATGGGRPHAAIGQQMVRGLAWTVFFTVGNRVLSFVSQFLLGWLLLPGDYRIYAFVAPVAGVSVSLVNGGLDRLLIQRSRKFHVLAWQSFKVATGCNLGLGVGMAVLAGLLAWKHDSATVGWLALLLAISTSFSSFPTLYMTKLQAELRFGPYSTLMLVSTTCSHLLSIVLAAFGAGPYAFIVPLVVMNFANVFLFRYAAGPLPGRGRLTWRRAKVMLWHCRWILATAFAAILIYNGDYLVIGWFNEPWLGTYFFGYKLSTAFTAIVSFAIAKVTLAGFAKIAKEPERFKAAVVRAAGLIALTTTPIAIALALLVPAAVHLAWQGKWDASIFVAALMTAVIPVDLLNIFCRTTLSSRGHWRTTALLGIGHGVGIMLAATAGCLIGEQWTTIRWVAFYQLTAGAIMVTYVFRELRVDWPTVRERVLLPAIIAFVPLVVVMSVVAVGEANLTDLHVGLLAAMTYLIGFGFLAKWAVPASWRQLRERVDQVAAKLTRRGKGRGFDVIDPK